MDARSLQICTIFVILIVGAIQESPIFLCWRAIAWQAASLLRKHCESAPTGLIVALNYYR